MLSRFRSPPLNVFFSGLPTTASRRSLRPSSISFASSRRTLQILTNGEVLVERVLLRHVADVLFQNVEVSVEGLSVEQDFAARRLELAGKHSHQRAFARAACAHHANKLSTRDAEGNSIEANFAFAKTVCDL